MEIDLSHPLNQKELFADLHIHSRFSRACSTSINIPNLVKWARVKGLGLLGTGDFQHPEWFKEICEFIARPPAHTPSIEEENGILWYKGNESSFPFIWQTEISLMYTQGKGRRVHLVVLAPSKEIVKQIINYLGKKGRLDYDGRPIFKIPCYEFVEEMKKIDDKIEVIPAHCLVPDSFVHTGEGVKKIKEIKKGGNVLTHTGKFRKVEKIFKRDYLGDIIRIVPSCLKIGSWFTPEHPVYSIKSYKYCKNMPHTICKPTCAYLKKGCKIEAYKDYRPKWVNIKDLEKGDIILYPRYKKVKDISYLDLSKILNNFYIEGSYIKSRKERAFVKNLLVNKRIEISEGFCRLIGYYLAEGYTTRDYVGFAFNKDEIDYLKDLEELLIKIFGPFLNIKFVERDSKGVSLIIYSKVLAEFFKMFYGSNIFRAYNKKLPNWFLDLPINKLKHLLIGWWRGDNGVTTSVNLMNQFKTILIKIGVIPSIDLITAKSVKKRRKQKPNYIDQRKISVNKDYYSFRTLCFFNECKELLDIPEFKKFKTKLNRRRGWIDNNYVYLPILRVNKKNYKGLVYNLEVKRDNSYLTENLSVHNCWTSWFGVFGSNSGFDSLKEAFQNQTDKIHAIETGLSSDPKMNWKIKELNNKSIVSFSDAHSFWPHRLGRECTIFNISDLNNPSELNYNLIIKQIRENSFLGTVEVSPAYGKYHWDGHRNCGFSCSPEESKKLKGICPKCRKPLTIGVEYRVNELTNQSEEENKNKKYYYTLLPLHEIISLALGIGLNSKGCWSVYNSLIERFGNEFNVLLKASKIELAFILKNELLVELIMKNRAGNIKVKPGFDGEYGVALLDKSERQEKLF